MISPIDPERGVFQSPQFAWDSRNVQAGRVGGEMLAEAIGGKGKVILGTFPAPSTLERVEGVLPSCWMRFARCPPAVDHADISAVKSAQRLKASERAWRYEVAVSWYRRGRKIKLIWSCADRNL